MEFQIERALATDVDATQILDQCVCSTRVGGFKTDVALRSQRTQRRGRCGRGDPRGAGPTALRAVKGHLDAGDSRRRGQPGSSVTPNDHPPAREKDSLRALRLLREPVSTPCA